MTGQSRRPRVVAVSPYVPYPGIDHAGGAFLLAYLDRLREDADITLVAPATEINTARSADSPVPVRLVSATVSSGWLVRKVDAFLRGPSPGRDLLRSIEHDANVAALLVDAEIVELHWGHLLPLAPWLKKRYRAAIVAHGHDVIAQSAARRAETRRGISRILRRLHARRIAAKERDYLNSCAVGYYFSEKDVELLREVGVRIPLRVIDPNLDVPIPRSGPAAGHQVLFVGALQRPENSEGVEWFVRVVWPRVRARISDAKFVIAGANPPDAIVRAGGSDIAVTGYVPTLAPYYDSASVFVAPVLSGAGLKFKVAQALLHGLPVVATEVGAEGFDAAERVLAAVTDDPVDMADAIVGLLTDPVGAADVGRRGRDWAAARFSFMHGVRQVLQDYQTLLAGGSLTPETVPT